MTVRSKAYFEALLLNGYIPDQTDFADLVESYQDIGGGGVVMQTAFVTNNSTLTTTSTTMVDSGISIVLANNLQSSASQVRIRATIQCSNTGVANDSFTLFRGATDLTPGGSDEMITISIPGANYGQNAVFEWIDTPGTITPATYHLYWKVSGSTGYINFTTTGYVGSTTIVAEELVSTVGSPKAQTLATVTPWTQTTTTIDATTTPPTKGTVTRDNLYYRQVGDSMEIKVDYLQSAGGSAGSGTYLFTIPNGLTIDSSKVTIVTDAASPDAGIGAGYSSDMTSFTHALDVKAYDTNHLSVLVKDVGALGSTVDSLGGEMAYSFVCTVPIVEWATQSGTQFPFPGVSLVDIATASGLTLQTPSNFTVGSIFTPLAALTITGIRLNFQQTGVSLICNIWDPTSTVVATVTVSITATGTQVAKFSIPYTIPTSNIGATYTVSYYESSGTYTTVANSYANTIGLNSYSPPGIMWQSVAVYQTANAIPTITGGAGRVYPVEPFFG